MNNKLNIVKTVSLFLFTSQISHAQPLSLDQSFTINYNFDVGKHAYGIREISTGTFFCYGEFAPFSNLDFRNGIIFDINGVVDTGFEISPATNTVISYSFKTIDNNLFIQDLGQGFRIVDLNGIDINLTYQSNINTFLPTSSFFPITESFYSSSHYLISGCFPNPCTYPAVNPTTSFYLYRLDPDGLLDTNFTHNTNGPPSYVKGFGDTVVYISGSFTMYDTIFTPKLAKTNVNGDIDTSFKSKFVWGEIYPAYLQNDGKLIVTGIFKIQGISDTLGIIRLLSNGDIDTTFNNNAVIISPNIGFGYNTIIGAVCKTSDDGFLIGGRFSVYDGIQRGSIVKTDENGFIDISYLNGSGFDSHPYPTLGIPPTVNNILLGSDNKYYITGWFNGFNGQSTQPVVRLNALQSGDSEDILNSSISIYPNPVSNLLNISIGNYAMLKKFNFRLIDVMGNIIMNNQINDQHTTIDISSITNGVYFVSLRSDLHNHNQVIVKAK